MQAGSKVVEVDFIVVDAYSLYTIRAVSLTLHLKVKYPSGDQIEELMGSQSMAMQCLVAVIMHQLEAESLTSIEGGS